MLQKNKLALALALASLVSVSAHAGLANTGEISYSYIGLGYSADSVDSDEGNVDLTGGALYGSLAITKNIYLQGNVSARETEKVDEGFGEFKIDFADVSFGIGGRIPVGKAVDLVAIGAYTSGKAGVTTSGYVLEGGVVDSIPSIDYSGYSFSAGVRAKPASRFELGGLVGYVSSKVDGAGGSESNVGYNAYVRGFATKRLSFGAALRGVGDSNGYIIDARFDF